LSAPQQSVTHSALNEENRISVALAFIHCINSRDPDALAELMTEDHEFNDMEGRDF